MAYSVSRRLLAAIHICRSAKRYAHEPQATTYFGKLLQCCHRLCKGCNSYKDGAVPVFGAKREPLAFGSDLFLQQQTSQLPSLRESQSRERHKVILERVAPTLELTVLKFRDSQLSQRVISILKEIVAT